MRTINEHAAVRRPTKIFGLGAVPKPGAAGRRHVFPRHGGAALGHGTRRTGCVGALARTPYARLATRFGVSLLAFTALASAQPPADLAGRVRELLRAGRIAEAVAHVEEALRQQPDDPAVTTEFKALHLTLAREQIRAEQFGHARASLERVLTVEPEHEAATRLLESLRQARRRVPAKLREARRLVELELFDAAVQMHQQAATLWPFEARRAQHDYHTAVTGAGDDHYLSRNFREAAFYYDLATRKSGQPNEAMMTRWALSLILARREPPHEPRFDEPTWIGILRRLSPHLRDRGLDAWLNVLSGMALEDRGNLARAAEPYARALGRSGTIAPHDATVELLASLRERATRSVLGAYDQNRVTRRGGMWAVAVGERFRQRVTPHFRVHHLNDLVGRRVASACEYHFPRIIKAMGLSSDNIPWPRRCDVYIHHDGPALARATGRSADLPGVSRSRSRDGRLLDHAIHVNQRADMLLSAVIPHELAHLLLAAATGYRPLPLALDEGFALRFEPPARHIRYDRLLVDGRNKWPPARLLTATKDTVDDQLAFYASARGFVDFLIASRGMTAFVALCRDRSDINTALRRHHALNSPAEARAAWDAFLHPQPTRNGTAIP